MRQLLASVPLTCLAALVSAPATQALPAPLDTARPICNGVEGYSASFGGRRTFLWHPDQLMRLKAARDSDPQVKAAYDQLIAKADVAMTRMLYTVVDKTTIPYSGDRHDYISTVANWFPDPANPKGPYIRGEGSNPERLSDKYDIADLDRMSSDVELLALAYYFSENPRYATRAASLVRTWFITPTSRMNPNMNFAQTVVGREKGRPDGVLETARIQRVIESVGLIGPSGKWTADDGKGLEKWFSDYVDWMRTAPHGKGASIAKSYHSLWYDAQLAQFALYARRPDVAKQVVADFPKNRFPVHFGADGKMVLELPRSRSLYYSAFALSAAYNVADIGRCVGVDLWNVNEGGRGLKPATEFLAAYSGKTDNWPYPESNKSPNELNDILHRANRSWGAPYPATPRADTVRYMRANWGN
jgi:hypothetical protein